MDNEKKLDAALKWFVNQFQETSFILLLNFPLMYSNKDMIYFIFIVN